MALFGLGNIVDFEARYVDKTINRWSAVDALAEINIGFSPYVVNNNNPIIFIDPNGMNAENTNDVTYSDGYSTQSYRNATGIVSIMGGQETQGSKVVYQETKDKTGQSTITRTQNGVVTHILTGEQANLFKVLAIEGGYTGVGNNREGEYGLAIIMASIQNRLNYGYIGYNYDEKLKTLEDVYSMGNGREYNAYNNIDYKNFNITSKKEGFSDTNIARLYFNKIILEPWDGNFNGNFIQWDNLIFLNNLNYFILNKQNKVAFQLLKVRQDSETKSLYCYKKWVEYLPLADGQPFQNLNQLRIYHKDYKNQDKYFV